MTPMGQTSDSRQPMLRARVTPVQFDGSVEADLGSLAKRATIERSLHRERSKRKSRNMRGPSLGLRVCVSLLDVEDARVMCVLIAQSMHGSSSEM